MNLEATTLRNTVVSANSVDKKYDLTFDILRVLAIGFIILVRHIDDYASEMYQCDVVVWLTNLSLSLLVFISGSLLAKATPIFDSRQSVGKFLLKRVLRIYPLYALTLGLFFISSLIDRHQLISGLFFLNLFNGEYVFTLWYISMIMALYVIFVPFNFSSGLKQFCMTGAVVGGLLVLTVLLFRKSNLLLHYFFPFIFGILAARQNWASKMDTLKSSLALFCCCAMIAASIVLHPPATLADFILSVTAGVPALHLLSKMSINDKVRTWIRTLSYASFCMYLSHRLIYHFALQIYKPNTDCATLLYLYIIATPLMVVVSYQLQKRYDQLLRHLSGFRQRRS